MPSPSALQVWAPTPRYQMPGITRRKVLELCQAAGIPVRELDFSLTQAGLCGWDMGGLLLLACRHSAVQAQHSSTS